MIKSIFKFVKRSHIINYCSNASATQKDFFRDLMEHSIKVQKNNSPKGYQNLTSIQLENQEIVNQNKFIKIDENLNRWKEDFVENSLLHGECNIESENVDKLTNNLHDYNDTENKISIENLQKGIEDIDLEEIKSTPIELLNIGPIINKNETLKNLLKYGVNLHEIESKAGGSNILVRLDWNKTVLPVISFFKEQAEFTDKQLANIFSKYPRVFRKPLVEIVNIIDYFKSRGISSDQLVQIISLQPYVLHLEKAQLQRRLNEFEKLAHVKAQQMNELIIAEPRILVENHLKVKDCVVQLNKGFGFTVNETRSMLLKAPSILLKNKDDLMQNFVFLHRALSLSYEDIVDNAVALAFSPGTLSERVKYLIYLKRYQTDPTKELYTPLTSIASGNEKHFCENVAHTSVSAFRRFLKTI